MTLGGRPHRLYTWWFMTRGRRPPYIIFCSRGHNRTGTASWTPHPNPYAPTRKPCKPQHETPVSMWTRLDGRDYCHQPRRGRRLISSSVSIWILLQSACGERADRGLLEAMQRQATATAGGYTPQEVANLLSCGCWRRWGDTYPDGDFNQKSGQEVC